MERETYFFRNIDNITELKEKNNKYIHENKKKSKYIIIKTIELEKEEYIEFAKKLHHNYHFLYDYIKDMMIDRNEVWRCIKVKNKDNEDSIIVQNDGYSYPRFVGIENN